MVVQKDEYVITPKGLVISKLLDAGHPARDALIWVQAVEDRAMIHAWRGAETGMRDLSEFATRDDCIDLLKTFYRGAK